MNDAPYFDYWRHELKRLNVVLEQRVAARIAALTAMNRELEAFAYSVSHELRAPLRAIDGFSHVLHETFGAELPPSAHHYIERISAGVQRMHELINGLLELSQVTRGELRVQPVDLSALALAVVAELRHADGAREVEIVIAGEVRATGDTRLLRIVLDNLLGNAWKFTSGRESAPSSSACATTRPTRPSTSCATMVRGSTLKRQPRNYSSRFSALHRAEDFSGTGVGLATVQRVITRHGGRIWATVPRGGVPRFLSRWPAAAARMEVAQCHSCVERINL